MVYVHVIDACLSAASFPYKAHNQPEPPSYCQAINKKTYLTAESYEHKLNIHFTSSPPDVMRNQYVNRHVKFNQLRSAYGLCVYQTIPDEDIKLPFACLKKKKIAN